MRGFPSRLIPGCLGIFLVLSMAACSFQNTSQHTSIGNDATSIKNTPVTRSIRPFDANTVAIETISNHILTNMHMYAWNPEAVTQGIMTGGLVINWKMSNPSLINAVTPGPDGNALHNHDPQVDLLYLTSLADYIQQHPGDVTYSSDFLHMQAVVHSNFQQYNIPKGWIYFAILKAGQIANNKLLVQDAYTIAQNFYLHWYNPSYGLVYDKLHFPNDYSTNLSLECGAALIDAGIRWNQPAWVKAGQNTLNHVISTGISPTYHLFYNSMFVSRVGPDRVENYQAKHGTQGEAIDALVKAYTLTGNQYYLDVAQQVVTSTLITSGLWDASRQGFYFALDMSTGTLLANYKETRSQAAMLLAVHDYNQIQPTFITQERAILLVILNHFYQPVYGGFFYRVAPNFQVYINNYKTGVQVEDYFSTEAMGSTLDALLQV